MRNPRRKPDSAGGRLLVLAAASLLLSSCALLQKEEAAAPSAPAATPAPATTPQPTTSAGLPEETTDNSELTDAINRDGRIIQLGSFAEQGPAVQAPANNVVELNYEQEDLRLVLEELGNALNINMVIDPTLDNKVSIRTAANNPLRYEDIWPLMRMLARNAGVTIEQVGNVYRFTRNASNIPTEIVLPGGLDNASSPEVLQVTPLTYISIEAAETVLNPLLQPAGSIIRLGPANLLGIIGSPEQLERINALLAVMDDDPFQNQGIQLYQLQNSKASEVAEELTSVLKLIEGEQTAYQVLGLDRINAVMVLAPAARGFAEVTNWVRILDAASQEQVEQLFVYKVKSLNAVTLAETLTSVFGEEDEDDQQQAARDEDESQPGDLINRAVPDAIPFNQTEPFVATPETQTGPGLTSSAVSADISVAIVSDEDTNSLLIRASPREYRQLLTTISTLDVAPAQVLINAVIGQATLTDNTQFGIDWTRVSSNLASGPAQISSSFLPQLDVNDAGELVRGGEGLVFTKTFMDGATVIDATLRAISTDNDVQLLSRPTILATNNQEGEIKVGQAVPVNNGTDTNANGTTSSNIAYRDVGIVLTITPHINSDGFINLEIFQSLSSIEGSNGVGGNPTFANQEITTTAVVQDQSTITLGGLIQEQDGDRSSGIPVLNKIPVLGALFSYQTYTNDRRELFVILHPQIVTNDSAGTALMQEYRAKFTMLADMLEEAGL
ncbi:MAG: type II secretion system secretin GspD [Pseudomonadota bacterium]